jgi:hypothetical protein
MMIRPRTYEITFTGRAGRAVRTEFEDCTVIAGSDTTTLRAQLPDQAALWGLILRIISLGLEVVDLHLFSPGGDDNVALAVLPEAWPHPLPVLGR